MGKQIFYKEDARQRLFSGIKMLYDAVSVTYGPKGGNVVIMDIYGVPSITHDGVTVAESITVDETPETAGYNVGIELIKQAATKLNSVVGDGTTTVTVLTYHIIEEANKLIKTGTNPQELRKELENASERLLAVLDELVEPISDQDSRLAAVATVSAGDKVIGELIASIVKEIGKDGVITVEPGQGGVLEHEIVEGFKFNAGFVSPLFITDPNTQQAIIDEPSVIIIDKTIAGTSDILPILKRATEANITNLIVVAESIKRDALNILLTNKVRGALNVVAIEATKEQMEDIKYTTGAMIMSDQTGISVNNASLDVLGKADKVIVGERETTIISGHGDKEQLQIHLDAIQKIAKKSGNKGLEKRHADINGKAAIIRVGGASESEIDEKKYRVDDAVAATKAALADGIVAGGGTTLAYLSNQGGVTNGDKVLKAALLKPIQIITENAQLDYKDITAKVLKAEYGYGIDVLNPTKELVDLKAKGIIDPLQVTKESLLSSISIAATVITIGALIVNEPKK
jgi:chaperonin GroEL